MNITLEEIQMIGETQSVEFKKSLGLQKEAMEALCGMLNTEGGRGKIIFGIGPDLEVIGIEPGNLDSAQRTLSQTIKQKFDPPIIANIQVISCENVNLILVEAQRSRDVPYHECDGRAFIRQGSERRQLSFDEKQSLGRKRNRALHNGPWLCDKCGAIVTGPLNISVITDQGVTKSYDCQCGGEFWPM